MAVEAGRAGFWDCPERVESAACGKLTINADEEKRKYFKILPNQVAPQGAKYSQEGVKKEREVEKVGDAVSLVFAML